MRNLALGEFFVNIGRAILLLSFAKFLYDETGQLWAFSLVFITEMVLAFIIPMIAGGAIDTTGAKKVIQYTAACSVLICFTCALFVNYHNVSVTILLLTSVALSAVNPIIKLSVFALTPELSTADELEKNNGSLVFAFQSGQLIGMGMAAWLLKYQTLYIIFIAVSFVYMASFIFYFFATRGLNITTSKNSNTAHNHPNNLTELFKVGRSFSTVLILSNFDFAAIAIFNLLLAAIVSVNYENNPMWLSGLDAAFAIGALLGGMLVAKQFIKRNTNITDSMRTQIFFVLYLVLFLLPSFKYLAPIVIMFFGAAVSFSAIFWNTRLQKDFPPEFKGRLAGARNLISSLYIGLSTMIVSAFHQLTFELAIAAALAITFIHIICLLAYKHKTTKRIILPV